MEKLLYNRYDKSLIPQLPRVVFQGRIVVVQSAGEAERAVDYLLSCDLLGIDSETRPSFRRGENHKVSLLQVSTRDICFLFRLNMTGLTPSLLRLLEDTTVPKVGLSLQDDMLMLHKRAAFTPGLFIDLQHEVKRIGIEDMSLQKLYANFFGMRIRKREQLSNWERDVLTDAQKLYAATDAWACISLYEELLRLEDTGDYRLVVVPDPVQPQQQASDITNETPLQQ